MLAYVEQRNPADPKGAMAYSSTLMRLTGSLPRWTVRSLAWITNPYLFPADMRPSTALLSRAGAEQHGRNGGTNLRAPCTV